MANRLFIYVPFRKDNDSDIKRGAQEFGAVASINITTTSGHNILAVHVKFLGEEPAAADIDANDVVLVHAHGGTDDTSLSDNSGGSIPLATLQQKLNNFRNAGAFYFAACFSSRKGHIADKWAKSYENVYGYNEALQGALVSTLRGNKYRTSMLEDDRMKKIAASK